MGEFGAVSVVSGHIRGRTNTHPAPRRDPLQRVPVRGRVRGRVAPDPAGGRHHRGAGGDRPRRARSGVALASALDAAVEPPPSVRALDSRAHSRLPRPRRRGGVAAVRAACSRRGPRSRGARGGPRRRSVRCRVRPARRTRSGRRRGRARGAPAGADRSSFRRPADPALARRARRRSRVAGLRRRAGRGGGARARGRPASGSGGGAVVGGERRRARPGLRGARRGDRDPARHRCRCRRVRGRPAMDEVVRFPERGRGAVGAGRPRRAGAGRGRAGRAGRAGDIARANADGRRGVDERARAPSWRARGGALRDRGGRLRGRSRSADPVPLAARRRPSGSRRRGRGRPLLR